MNLLLFPILYSNFNYWSELDGRIQKSLMSVAVSVPQVYLISVCILFCVIGFIISVLFSKLCEEVKQLTTTSSSDFDSCLKRCHNLHVLNRDLAHRFNDCFGNLLLFTISFFYVVVINGSYSYFIHDFKNYIPYIIYPLVHLSLICFVSYRIQTKVELPSTHRLIFDWKMFWIFVW